MAKNIKNMPEACITKSLKILIKY